MCNKNLNDNWLASEESDKKKKKKHIAWFIIKAIVRVAYCLCKLMEFLDPDSPS